MSESNSSKLEWITFQVTPEEKEQVREYAAIGDRSISGLMRYLLKSAGVIRTQEEYTEDAEAERAFAILEGAE